MDGCFGFTTIVALGVGSVVYRIWRSRQLAPALPFKPNVGGGNALASSELTPERVAPGSREAGLLAALRQNDPTFAPQRLLERLWLVCREARSVRRGGDDSLLRALVSDGLLPSLVTPHTVRSSREETLTHATELASVVLTDVEVTGPLQVVRVRLVATTELKEQLTSVWSLARRIDAKSRPAGLLEGKCPSCGAPLKLNAMARCGHCDVIVNSGLHDWVVTAVADATDTQRWVEPVFDPDELMKKDPGLNRCFVEERATFAFWRWQHTLAQRNLAPLRGAATEAFVEHFSRTLARAEQFTDIDLRRTRLVALREGDTHQSALVEVLWTAAHHGARDTVRLALELRRRSGATSPLPLGLSSARCAKCLGPQREDAGVKCAWCGSEMPDAWYLEGITPFLASEGAREARDANRAVHPKHELYLLLLGVALADGEVSAEEQKVLSDLAKMWGYTPPTIDEAVRSKAWVSSVRLRPGSDDAALLHAFARRVAIADGEITIEEHTALRMLTAVLERQAAERRERYVVEGRAEKLGRLLS